MNDDKTLKELFDDANQFEHYQEPKQVARNKAKLAKLAKKIEEQNNDRA